MFHLLFAFLIVLSSQIVLAQAKVVNPGEAIGQLVYLSEEDVRTESPKFMGLSPLSIPVFSELPMDLSVVAGTITLKEQSLTSHVRIKSRARNTPSLDISKLEQGLQNPLFNGFADGDWVKLVLTIAGEIRLTKSTEAEALNFLNSRKVDPVRLKTDLSLKEILAHEQLDWTAADKVGSKAANYAELARLLNSESRTIVKPGFAIPLYYYQLFMDTNPKIKASVESLLRDPLMYKVAKVSYREAKLKALRDMIMSSENPIPPVITENVLAKLESFRTAQGLPRKMKLRSSTNSEDLPNFNGAGLYTSESYKPLQKGVEKARSAKEENLQLALRTVWASVWNLRAFDERNFFKIPHSDVRMGMQVNPSFSNEGVDGVVVTKNIAGHPVLQGPAVYIEAQRGDLYSVANPVPDIQSEKILVLYSDANDASTYRIHVLQRSNIADDMTTILPSSNPAPIMSDEEIKDLAFQSLRATEHFKKIYGAGKPDFSLDLEFKVDSEDTGKRQVYLKQARPFID